MTSGGHFQDTHWSGARVVQVAGRRGVAGTGWWPELCSTSMWLDVLGQSHPARNPSALGNGAEPVFLEVTDSSQRVPLFSCRQGPERRTVTPLPSSTSSSHLCPLLSHLGAETPVSRNQRDPRLDGHPRPKHRCPAFEVTGTLGGRCRGGLGRHLSQEARPGH